MSEKQTPELVGAPDDEREWRDGGELSRAQRGAAEDTLEGRQVDQRRGEDERDSDAGEQRTVAEHSHLPQRRVVGADRERGPDLAGDDAQPRHGGGLAVRVVHRSTGPGGNTGVPARVPEGEEERGHHQRGRDHAEKCPCSGQHPGADHALPARPRRAVHESGFGGFAAERERGQGVGTEVDGEDLHHGERQRYGAAGQREDEERQYFRHGGGEDVADELADVVVDPAAARAWSSGAMAQRASTSSGAPLVWMTRPVSVSSTVVMSLSAGSNRNSALRRFSRWLRDTSAPCAAANSSSAISVGSPVAAWVPSASSAVLHSAAAAASVSWSPSGLHAIVTCILFCVSVPVLSVQMTDVEPSVSTADRRLTRAPRRAMSRTPTASASVIVGSSPSGTFATSRPMAKLIAAANVSPAARPIGRNAMPAPTATNAISRATRLT